MTTPEVTDMVAVDFAEDSRGEDVPVEWRVYVSAGDASVHVYVSRNDRDYKIVGWALGEDNRDEPTRTADTLDEDVASAVDEYVHRGRR